MKKILALLLLIVCYFVAVPAQAQDKKNTSKTIIIKTSAQCEMCKARIEKALSTQKGIKKAVLDVETKNITITYNAGKIGETELRKLISNTGYNADNVRANSEAYKKLPSCCKID